MAVLLEGASGTQLAPARIARAFFWTREYECKVKHLLKQMNWRNRPACHRQYVHFSFRQNSLSHSHGERVWMSFTFDRHQKIVIGTAVQKISVSMYPYVYGNGTGMQRRADVFSPKRQAKMDLLRALI